MFRKEFSSLFVRNISGETLSEMFLVSAVSSIFLLRFYLFVTGYPQISGGNYHIAHMLWGGLFMLVSILVSMSFLTRLAYRFSAIVGGVGFGIFIDELGKFITRDNNYFFEPTIALIYVIFVLLFLFVQTIEKKKIISEDEYLINALETLKQSAVDGIDLEEKDRILDFLYLSNKKDPFVQELIKVISALSPKKDFHPNIFIKIEYLLREFYYKLTKTKWFSNFFVTFMVIQSVIILMQSLLQIDKLFFNEASPSRSISDIALFTFPILSSLTVIGGVMFIHKSKLFALKMFKWAILISILLTQPFLFYKVKFFALVDLSISLVIFITLQFMISRELRLRKKSD